MNRWIAWGISTLLGFHIFWAVISSLGAIHINFSCSTVHLEEFSNGSWKVACEWCVWVKKWEDLYSKVWHYLSSSHWLFSAVSSWLLKDYWFPSQRASNVESVSILCPHHDLLMHVSYCMWLSLCTMISFICCEMRPLSWHNWSFL